MITMETSERFVVVMIASGALRLVKLSWSHSRATRKVLAIFEI